MIVFRLTYINPEERKGRKFRFEFEDEAEAFYELRRIIRGFPVYCSLPSYCLYYIGNNNTRIPILSKRDFDIFVEECSQRPVLEKRLFVECPFANDSESDFQLNNQNRAPQKWPQFKQSHESYTWSAPNNFTPMNNVPNQNQGYPSSKRKSKYGLADPSTQRIQYNYQQPFRFPWMGAGHTQDRPYSNHYYG
ncbi:hypothetical protein ACOME3_000636 [Neoechinorhynchus agilis]